jgi:NitT/TauT family transport system ATP-binding protein
MMQDIVLKRVSKTYNGEAVIRNFSCVIPAGRVTALMAPSGSGKTTLLRMITGLSKPDSGSITGAGQAKVGMVFQEDRLLGRLDAVSNIRLVTPSLSGERAEEELKKMGLGDALSKKVSEMSGGMKRRVAILRALLSDCELLLLDEPFTGLDEETRDRVIARVKALADGKTVILVTHEEEDALKMGADIIRLG